MFSLVSFGQALPWISQWLGVAEGAEGGGACVTAGDSAPLAAAGAVGASPLTGRAAAHRGSEHRGGKHRGRLLTYSGPVRQGSGG